MRLVLLASLVAALAAACASHSSQPKAPQDESTAYLLAVRRALDDDPRRGLSQMSAACTEIVAAMSESATTWTAIQAPPEIANEHEDVGEALQIAASKFEAGGDGCRANRDALNAGAAYRSAYQQWCRALVSRFGVDTSWCEAEGMSL